MGEVLTNEHGGERTKYFAFAHFSCSKYFAHFTYFNFVYICKIYLIFTSGGEVLTNERGGESTED